MGKRKNNKRIWGMLICMVMLMCMFPLQAEAKAVKKTLYVGNILNLTYSNKSVKWSTSNKAVAKISNTSGKNTVVTGVKAGKAIIKAKVSGKVMATCIVNVKNHTLKLSKSSASVKVGKTTTLVADTTAASPQIKWTSSNKSIVSVSGNGRTCTVSGKKSGTATITCKISGNASVKKTCKVTVKKSGSTSTGTGNTSFDPNRVIKNYFASNPTFTKVSDGKGNGNFCELNGHAAPQQASFTMNGTMEDKKNPYMATASGTYKYFWSLGGQKFNSISWEYPISLSFNDTTFQTGETCGVLRVLNSVPGSSYTWSSSNSNIVGIKILGQDTSAIQILAKKSGSVSISCKVKFPNGETKTLTSKVNVSDSIEKNIKNGSVDMNSVMEKVANAYRSDQNVNWIPDAMGIREANSFGYTALGSYGSYDISYKGITDATKVNELRPMKYLNNPEGYIVHYASEIESNAYFLVEYQGHNTDEGCIQMASVGVLSIPTVK